MPECYAMPLPRCYYARFRLIYATCHHNRMYQGAVDAYAIDLLLIAAPPFRRSVAAPDAAFRAADAF